MANIGNPIYRLIPSLQHTIWTQTQSKLWVNVCLLCCVKWGEMVFLTCSSHSNSHGRLLLQRETSLWQWCFGKCQWFCEYWFPIRFTQLHTIGDGVVRGISMGCLVNARGSDCGERHLFNFHVTFFCNCQLSRVEMTFYVMYKII